MILCLSLLVLVAVSYAFYPALIGFVFDALEAKNTNLLFQLAGLLVLISIVKAFAVYRQIQVVNKLVFSIKTDPNSSPEKTISPVFPIDDPIETPKESATKANCATFP